MMCDDDVWWWCVVMLCGDIVNGSEGSGKVKWLILSCWGVLVTDWQTDRQTDERTDIGGCRVAFATEMVLSEFATEHSFLSDEQFISWNVSSTA